MTNPIKLKHLKNLPPQRRRWQSVVRVKSISKTNLNDNFFCDLEVQDNHNYLAGQGGFVFIHNTVLHGFLGERIKPEAAKKLVKKVAENFHLPYFTLTPTYSICPEHGYLSGEYEKCPKCQKPTEVYSRIVGYLRPLSQWNEGKKSEFKDRLKYKVL